MNNIPNFVPMWISLISAVATIMLVFVTFILCLITLGYLLVTAQMSKVSYKTYQVDLSPKVFVDDIKTRRHIDLDNKKFHIQANFLIKNYGRTEAENVVISYEISSEGKVLFKKQLNPAPFIFPTKIVTFNAKSWSIGLTPHGIDIITEAKKTGKKLNITKDFASPVDVEVNIKYLDHEKQEKSISALFKYNWDSNQWDYTVAEEDQEEITIQK